jgi:hypothetical protein
MIISGIKANLSVAVMREEEGWVIVGQRKQGEKGAVKRHAEEMRPTPSGLVLW